MFCHRQPLRRWAARVLLLWLFGIGAGVANACLVPHLVQADQGIAHHLSGEDGFPGGSADAASAHQHGPGQGLDDHAVHDAPAAPAEANCQDFCGKASISIPPLKSALDDACAHAAPLPALVAVLPLVHFEPPRQRALRRADGSAAPIPIAFLRLTL